MGVLMKKHKGDMDGAMAKTIAEEILKGGAPAAAPKEAKKEEKKEAPAAKKEAKKEKEAPAPKAADVAPAAGGEGRMVWRQGYYVDNVWQRGRYEVLHASLSPTPPAPLFVSALCACVCLCVRDLSSASVTRCIMTHSLRQRTAMPACPLTCSVSYPIGGHLSGLACACAHS
jgi:hypothetical protein